MEKPLNVRIYSWLQGGLSWAYVVSRLAQSFDDLGHNVYFSSTNGLDNNQDEYLTQERMLKSVIELQKFGPGKKSINIDLTYTIPPNLTKRFLPNSKHKCVIYNYESSICPSHWKKYYHLADYFFPSSNFSAEIFIRNGVPVDKTYVIPHGIDTRVFNSSIKPIKLNTKKKYKFVSVCAPHVRKNLPLLLDSYCSAFTAKDDVCMVLKTKVYKKSDGIYHAQNNPGGRKAFEIIIGNVFRDLYKKYGRNIPEIELIPNHLKNPASLYNACDCHITTTGSEGFGMPMAEVMNSNLISIAPRYGGVLDFMNDSNSLLIDCTIRYAKKYEQYWGYSPKAIISEANKNHTIELMRKVYENHDELLKKFEPEMKKTVSLFSWNNATQKITDVVNGKISPYIPGTYKF